MKKLILYTLSLTLGLFGASYGQAQSATTQKPATNSETVATLNGKPITKAELEKRVAGQMVKLNSQIYRIQRQGIEGIINEQLLADAAKKQNLSVQAFIKKEVDDKVGEVSEEEVTQFYNSNQKRFGGKSLEDVKAGLKKQLQRQRASVYRKNLIDRLKNEANIKILIERPTVNVSVDDDPMKGKKDARVTIIEFTDYQCPFCARARPTIAKVLEAYPNDVRYVLRDFPLNFHKDAKKAAEAAHCAGDQGKYWEFSDILWKNAKSLQVDKLKVYATQLSLDQAKFDQCLDSGKYSAEVAKDIADGSKAGVSGTPAFFINGQMLSGARPFSNFKEIIDEELQSKQAKKDKS